jgi:hypothetical protein
MDEVRTLLSLRLIMGKLMAGCIVLLCLGMINRNPSHKTAFGLSASACLVSVAILRSPERRLNRKLRQSDEAIEVGWIQGIVEPLINFGKRGTELKGVYQADEPFTGLDEVDVAQCLATTRSGSTMIACPSGTGKSNLLRAAIAHAHRHYGGAIQFKVVAGKPDETYSGLETTADYIESAPDTASEVYEAFLSIRGVIENPDTPAVLIADEYNNTLGDLETASKELLKRTKRTNYEIVTKGRSKAVYAWFTSHSPFVQDVGFNSAIQESFNIICLGRGNKTTSIYKALSGKRQVIDDDERREFLNWQFKEHKKSEDYDGDRVICLTNIRGEWELVILPIYGDANDEIYPVTPTELPMQLSATSPQLDRAVASEFQAVASEFQYVAALQPHQQRLLFDQIMAARRSGTSDTDIIKNVLGFHSRRYGKGRALFDEILVLGKIKGWQTENREL